MKPSFKRRSCRALPAALALAALPFAADAQAPRQAPPEPSPHQSPHSVPSPPERRDGPSSRQPAPEMPAPETPEQRAKLFDELYARLAEAPDAETANQVASALEKLGQHSGSPTADLLVARAVASAEAGNRTVAMKLLDAAVDLQPDYAEAWNRRAYLYYLDNDYRRALGDLRRVLALDPRNFKALESLGNLLQHLGEKKAALDAYESALKVHPYRSDARKARDDLKSEVEGQGI